MDTHDARSEPCEKRKFCGECRQMSWVWSNTVDADNPKYICDTCEHKMHRVIHENIRMKSLEIPRQFHRLSAETFLKIALHQRKNPP